MFVVSKPKTDVSGEVPLSQTYWYREEEARGGVCKGGATSEEGIHVCSVMNIGVRVCKIESVNTKFGGGNDGLSQWDRVVGAPLTSVEKDIFLAVLGVLDQKWVNVTTNGLLALRALYLVTASAKRL